MQIQGTVKNERTRTIHRGAIMTLSKDNIIFHNICGNEPNY